MKTYLVYVWDASGWDQAFYQGSMNCDYETAFFGPDHPGQYVHPVEGGSEPIGHVVIKGHRAAVALRDHLNISGDWEDENGEDTSPTYAIKEA